MLIDLMASFELEEAIESLRNKLFEVAYAKGFSDKETVEISQRLDIYLTKYGQMKNGMET